jgi:hypothetical protein
VTCCPSPWAISWRTENVFLQFKMQYIELSTIIIGVWKPYLEFWCIANA